jgi:hypothetical protein
VIAKPYRVLVKQAASKNSRLISTSTSTGDPEVQVEIAITNIPNSKLVEHIHKELRPVAAMIATRWFK